MNICLSCEGVTAAAAERCGHCGVPLLPLDCIHYPDRRGEADAGNPLLGSVIDGKFRLEGVLGRGGLGTVFQAEHIGSLMKVALKLLHPRFSERPEYRRALLPEARRAATVTNERCARLLDVGETQDGGTYLAMELVEGATIDAVVREGALRPSHAVELLVQIAEALVAIHAAGLVHCDLSPRNVMVAVGQGALAVKVLDFGIARTVSVPSVEDLTAGGFSGFANPAFSAPEHLAGKPVDPRADLYSLGALAWLMLTGKAPIDDSEPSRAAAAVVAGRLEAWPGAAGVPRRLVRLILRCLALDPAARPPSAHAVLRELRVVQGARRPVLQRAAVVALLAAVLATVPAFFTAAPVFLDPVVGSPLQLQARPPEVPEICSSARLSKLQFHFGGFAGGQLRLDVSRDGRVLFNKPLRPEVSEAGGTLTLSSTQQEWSGVLASLIEGSREGPVDLSFVVPGFAPLGSTRVRIDDHAPEVAAELVDITMPNDTLTSAAAISWQAADEVGLAQIEVVVETEGHGAIRLPLPAGERESSGRFALGEELKRAWTRGWSSGLVRVRVSASDRAGNERSCQLASFAGCDLHAPTVVSVAGPAGEPFLPSLGGTARLRVQLSEAEVGCQLVVRDRDGHEFARVGLETPGLVHDLEIPIAADDVPFASGSYLFIVEDPVGNRTHGEFACTLRDLSVRLGFRPVTGSATSGDALVLQRIAAAVDVRHSDVFAVVRATVSTLGLAGGAITDAVALERMSSEESRLTFGTLPVGVHLLELDLEDVGDALAEIVHERIPLRVLPDVIEIRIARAPTRYLPGLVQAGVLARSPNGYHEGAKWVLPSEFVPLLRGDFWIGFGGEVPVPTGLRAGSSPTGGVLPDFVPLPGRTLLAVSLTDVLDRPVRVFVGDVPARRMKVQGQDIDVVAEFWWHDQPPVPIGEELMVEHGQAARLRLRLPLPYTARDREQLRLGLGPSEFVASAVVPEGDEASVVTFDLPFSAWSAAAQLADLPREDYSEHLARSVDVAVHTPVGRDPIELLLRTTRSTLRPIRLDELGALPDALGAMRLVPVLAPDHPFADPVPDSAPPRPVFRPQVSVDVRNMRDILLQDREITCGQARALVGRGLALAGTVEPSRLVHADDPLAAR
ncbi:MAG: serine/threonine protein kinase, partial [Planctomycetes bacterium]|nr:serine/threonine protein kinase [Planctomycetota bacterium]